MQHVPEINFTPVHPPLKVNKSFFRIGDQLITLEKYGNTREHNYVLVGLHNDAGFLSAGFTMVGSYRSGLINLVNTNGRQVVADLFDQKLVFDPNNIFTSWGRREHLKKNHCWSKSSDEYVQQLARFVLNEIPADKTVVMFSDKKENIEDYMQEGTKEKQAKDVFLGKTLDANTMFFTPDEEVFNRLKAQDLNVVLQQTRKIEDDGSLPVYCAKADRNYLTVTGGSNNTIELMKKVHEVLQ